MVYIYYAYTGWNSASYLAGEIRDAQRRLPWAILLGTAGVTLLYLALNVVYALALSAADIRAIVDDPSNQAGREAVEPIAQIAAARLFGPRWSTPLSIVFGAMLLSTLSAYVLIGPRVVFAMAQGRSVSVDRGPADPTGGHAGRRHGTSEARGTDPALDRLIRESDHLCGRRSLDLFDACRELDLRSSVETPRHEPAVSDPGISGHARNLSSS